jgi:hypothetical protein
VDVGEDLEFRRTADVVGSNGSIMPVVSAMWRIHLSLLMLMLAFLGTMSDCRQRIEAQR